MINRLVLFVILISGSLSAFEVAQNSMEMRISGAIPVSGRYREIYGDIQASYELQVNTFLMQNISSWVNAGWITKKGFSTGCTRTPTRIEIASLSLGGNYFLPIYNNFSFYAGLGVILSQVNVKNHHEGNAKAFSPGAVIKAGLNIDIFEDFYAGLFSDYYWQPGVYKTNVDIGGIRIGLGLGYKFP